VGELTRQAGTEPARQHTSKTELELVNGSGANARVRAMMKRCNDSSRSKNCSVQRTALRSTGHRFVRELVHGTFKLSLRDLVIIMADRGISVTHTTILRWVLRYVREFEKRSWRYARPVGGSWRMDETYVWTRHM